VVTQDQRIIPYPIPGLRRSQIANRLNALHFRGDPILVILRHREYDYTLTLRAHPEISHGERLRALWDKESRDLPRNLHLYRLEKILIPGIANTLELKTDNVWLESDWLQVELPEKLPAITCRNIDRRPGDPSIEAHLSQNSIRFSGQLVDCSAEGLRLEITLADHQSFCWFQSDQNITLTLSRQGRVVFSGPVHLLRSLGDRDQRTVVVLPTESQVPRYQPREERTKRLTIHPSPDVHFFHPLTGLKTTLTVRDLASLGLSVREKIVQATLIPGMILENIELTVFGTPFISFSGQVVYRRVHDNEVICGIAILDIKVDNHSKLIGLVHQAENENSFVRLNHDPEKFFEFLFDTGFLYPSKYEEVHVNRESFLEAYRKLYLNENQIARCFVYLENGEILGHVSALRIYRHTWLDHHHAALTKSRSGLRVLRQVSDFHNDVHVLNPWQMRYVTGIWRPNNEFPAKVFGQLATNLGDPSLCSTDTFAYLRTTLDTCRRWDDLQGPWEVAKANREDIYEFEGYYHCQSGGLLCEAFDLTVDSFEDCTVADEYARSGLKRNRHLYAVRYGLELKALVEVQDSDTGLNLSELTNAVYIYVLDANMVTPKILEFIQCMVTVKHKRESLTVMLYPSHYAQRYQLNISKEYTVWILKLNSEGLSAYMKHLSRWCK
jgi:hypothetical protein